MINLYIEEEYGFRYWKAVLTEKEFLELVVKWHTMRGLYCSVPIVLIIPQAKEITFSEELPKDYIRCHIHECNDSFLEGVNYTIPEDGLFWIEGKSYNYEQLKKTFQSS